MSEARIEIRSATSEDAALLADLGARTFDEAFAADNSAEDMAAYLDSAFAPHLQAAEIAEPGSVFLIAAVDDTPVGYARVRSAQPPPGVVGERSIEIHRFYTATEWHGRGVAAALMESCLGLAAERSIDVVWLDVWERNARAIAFYEKYGFVVVGTTTFLLGDDSQHDLIMSREMVDHE